MKTSQIKNVLFFLYCLLFFIAASIPAVLTPFTQGASARASGAETDNGDETDIGAEANSRAETDNGAGMGSDEDDAEIVNMGFGTGGNEGEGGGEGIWGFDFSTSFGLRREMIALDAELRAALFRESSNSKIVYGNAGWLFLAETLDRAAPSNQAQGYMAPRIARSLWLGQEYAGRNGARFIFAAAPNKVRVYSEYLPYHEPWPGQEGTLLLDLVQERLDALDVRYVDLAGLFERLRGEDPDIQYYHSLDSHWNYLGAVEVYREMMAEFESALDFDFSYDKYFELPPRIEDDWPGDLERMLNPISERMDTQYYFDFNDEYRSRKPIVNPEDLNIISTTLKNDVRVLFFRDSFANALIRFFSNNLGEASYTRSMPFPLSRTEGGAYDIVVAEIAERNLNYIIEAAPAIPAPLRAKTSGIPPDRNHQEQSRDPGNGSMPVDMPVDMPGHDFAISDKIDTEILLRLWEGAQPLQEGSVIAGISTPSLDDLTGQGIRAYGCFDPSLQSPGYEIRIFPVFESIAGEALLFEAFPILESDMYGVAAEHFSEASTSGIAAGAAGIATIYGGVGADISDCGFSFQINDLELTERDYIVRVLLISCNLNDGGEAAWSGISEPLTTYSKSMSQDK